MRIILAASRCAHVTVMEHARALSCVAKIMDKGEEYDAASFDNVRKQGKTLRKREYTKASNACSA
eukprot:6213416-Pleurochrysis_carterae.AAC.7